MVIFFCLSFRLFVCSFVCRLRNLLSHSLRGSTLQRWGAFRLVSDTVVLQAGTALGAQHFAIKVIYSFSAFYALISILICFTKELSQT